MIGNVQPINVLIADDHTLFADGVKHLLQTDSTVTVVSTAQNGHEVIRKLQQYEVDVIILDIRMPELDGVETASLVRKSHPKIKIIALSMFSEPTFILRMHDIGVHGYLLKNSTKDELFAALKAVTSGKQYFSTEVASSILSFTSQTGSSTPLTRREITIMSYIAKGMSNAQIAEYLKLSVQTISTHRKNIMQKLQIKSTGALVKYAIDNGYNA